MAGRPRTMLRKVQGLRERAVALLNDLDSTMPAKYRGRQAGDGHLVAQGWQWSRTSLAEAVADLSLLEGALAEKVLKPDTGRAEYVGTPDHPNAIRGAVPTGPAADRESGEETAE